MEIELRWLATTIAGCRTTQKLQYRSRADCILEDGYNEGPGDWSDWDDIQTVYVDQITGEETSNADAGECSKDP